MTDRIPPGSTITSIPGGKRITYPPGERLEIDAAQYAVFDPRDVRIAELERYMRHIRTLAHDADALASVDPAAILATIALLACDALAGAEPEPRATVKEAMAI